MNSNVISSFFVVCSYQTSISSDNCYIYLYPLRTLFLPSFYVLIEHALVKIYICVSSLSSFSFIEKIARIFLKPQRYGEALHSVTHTWNALELFIGFA